MKLVSGDLFWTDVTSIKRQFPYLDDNAKCDVCIIGGGITGALAAYYLKKSNVDVILVDKNIIGYGSTSASTAVLQYEIDTTLCELEKLIGEKEAYTAFKLCYEAVYEIENIIRELDIECGFDYHDCFYYTKSLLGMNEMVDEYNVRKASGFNVEYISEEDAKELFDFDVKAGIYSRSGSAIIDPYRLTVGIIHALADIGLRVYENTEIVDIICTPKPELITNNGFTINCDKIIVASGYEGRKHINDSFIDLYRTYAVVSKPLKRFNGWHKKCTIRDDEDAYTYIRTTTDNRVIVGGEDEKIGIISNLLKLENGDKNSEKKYEILIQRFKDYFPQIYDVEFEYRYNGLYGNTDDGLPYIGEYKGMPNCYFSLDVGGNGILYAVIAGKLIKDKYFNCEVPELEIFRFNR